MRLLAGILLSVFLVAAAGAQSVADVLRGSAQRIGLSDIPASYRAVSLGEGAAAGLGPYAFAGMWGGRDQDERTPLLLGLVGASFVDPDEFAGLLEGKLSRIRAYALDLTAMVRDAGDGVPDPVFAETWIEGGRIVQWSPRPALSRAALLKAFGEPGQPNVARAKTETLSNVKQVATGIMLYQTDNDDQFPAASATIKAQRLVEPYLKNSQLWKTRNPNGGRILYNTALSKVTATALEFPAETILLWDENPWPDGSRVVGFADGHAKSVAEAEWSALWSAELRRRSKR